MVATTRLEERVIEVPRCSSTYDGIHAAAKFVEVYKRLEVTDRGSRVIERYSIYRCQDCGTLIRDKTGLYSL